MTDYDDEFRVDAAAQRAARIAHVAKVAVELGTRAAARRLGLAPNTVTSYLRLSNGVSPSSLVLRVRQKRTGAVPRGYVGTATGRVRVLCGKARPSVRFSAEVEALTLQEVLEAVVHQAMAAARKKAGRG